LIILFASGIELRLVFSVDATLESFKVYSGEIMGPPATPVGGYWFPAQTEEEK
jgi:hypothetical protein